MKDDLYSRPRVFDPVWECIYCRSEEDLSEEHTLALGMRGNQKLPEASCAVCRVETTKFEQIVMRKMMWPLRHARGVHSGRRHIDKTLPVYFARNDGAAERVLMPPEDIPVKAVFPRFPHLPGCLCGRAPDADSECEIGGLLDPEALKRAETNGWANSSIYFNEEAFARMLAKTAHAQAVGVYGLRRFVPFLTDIVRGRAKNWAYYIGRALDGELEPSPNEREQWIHLMTRDRDGLLLARIQFFATQDTPVYYVVIGRLRTCFDLEMRERPLMRDGNICGAQTRPIETIRGLLAPGRYGPTPRRAVVLNEAA